MIASLGGYAFHSFATGLGGVVQGTAQSSAGDVARGSFNAGQVNYRNVSAGTTSLGSFVGWRTDFFTTSGLQHTVGNITMQGGRVEGKGLSVDNALKLAAIRGDDFTQKVIASMSAIAGQGASASMVINPQGRLEHAEMVSGDGGFKVVYDGRGRLVVMKGGVEHGSIELDEKGEIKGFETSVQVGGLSLDYVKTKAKEITETARAYSQVGEAFKTIASKGIEAVDLKSLRDNLSKIVQSDFASFLEAAKAWGVDKDIVQAILKTLGQKYGSEFKTRDSFGFEFNLSGGVGVGTGGGNKQGGSFWPLQFGGGASGGLNWNYTDEQVKAMSTYLSRDEKNELVNKFIESLQNKSGQRSSDSQTKKSEQSYTQGKDVSEKASNSKVYEVAEAFGKQAEEMLAYAERLQASLKQDPLNYYAQQKYKEALAAGKSKGEAVRYAMEEVAKLRSNPEALEKWLEEFAKGQGIRDPKVDEKRLEGIQSEVPDPKNVQEKGKQLQGEVNQQINKTQEEMSQRKKELESYKPPKAKLFNLQAPDIDLRFNLNDPKLRAYEKDAQKWFKEQPSIPVRIFNDGKAAVNWEIDLGKNLAKNLINAPNPKVGDRLNTPPLQGVP
ncbi:hypothetical protein THERU_05115 [Thermocrinis ruber]|uniref:Uncharacterized protein n=1 Tax=Thermocrinis ruber TaxID=75906 RepID=W0DIM1_9AQUI|nr:hypothetical protein [Thermocrinis ruber]AHE96853.1 hypothetical protein THERU_05115 [Thermocrinis ruber]